MKLLPSSYKLKEQCVKGKRSFQKEITTYPVMPLLHEKLQTSEIKGLQHYNHRSHLAKGAMCKGNLAPHYSLGARIVIL